MSNKSLWMILGVPLAALAVLFLLGGDFDRARYDRLEIGMSSKEVQDIIDPPTGGKYDRMRRAHFKTPPPVDATLTFNDRIVLIIRDGRLVEKRWIGKD
ncbi:MAG TPA: hypothetical protein VG013_16090 [Gemmataceae bacterium]|jgi:hypothetical protein|nr:hypothetical protein [Gemmataceae bacterium]